MSAVVISPRPAVRFHDHETVTFTTEAAARAYVDSRVSEHLRAHSSTPYHERFDAIVDAVTDEVYSPTHEPSSLCGIEALVHTAVVSLLY